MGVYNKEKYNMSRRRFGQPSGKNSITRKRKEKVIFLKREERTRLYVNDKKKYQPYQLVRKQCLSEGVYERQTRGKK